MARTKAVKKRMLLPPPGHKTVPAVRFYSPTSPAALKAAGYEQGTCSKCASKGPALQEHQEEGHDTDVEEGSQDAVGLGPAVDPDLDRCLVKACTDCAKAFCYDCYNARKGERADDKCRDCVGRCGDCWRAKASRRCEMCEESRMCPSCETAQCDRCDRTACRSCVDGTMDECDRCGFLACECCAYKQHYPCVGKRSKGGAGGGGAGWR